MTEENPEPKQEAPIVEFPSQRLLKVGEIELQSPENLDVLCSMVIWLLQQPEVKEYLELLKNKQKLTRSYIE